MRVSCGTPTPTGTYYTPARYRWLKMVGDTWAQWCTQIQGDYLFHSVPNWTKNNKDLEVYEYNQLGNTRSLGCIRLNCEDAKWIYDNCQLGTQVNISSTLTSGKSPRGTPGTPRTPQPTSTATSTAATRTCTKQPMKKDGWEISRPSFFYGPPGHSSRGTRLSPGKGARQKNAGGKASSRRSCAKLAQQVTVFFPCG